MRGATTSPVKITTCFPHYQKNTNLITCKPDGVKEGKGLSPRVGSFVQYLFIGVVKLPRTRPADDVPFQVHLAPGQRQNLFVAEHSPPHVDLTQLTTHRIRRLWVTKARLRPGCFSHRVYWRVLQSLSLAQLIVPSS